VVFSVLLLLFNLPQADADLCGDTVFLRVLNDDTQVVIFDGSGVVPWNPSPANIQIAPFVQIDVRVFCDGDDGISDGISTIFFDYVTAPTGPSPFPVPNHSFWFTDLDWTDEDGEVIGFTVGPGAQTTSLMTTGFGPSEAHATTGAFSINAGTSMLNDLILTAAHGIIPDHYFGYFVNQQTIPKFTPLDIILGDQFETGEYKVVKPKKIYNPAKKNGEPVNDRVTHLKAYKIRGDHTPVTDIILTNQFEQLVVNTKRVNSILVPTAKSHDGPTDPLIDTPVDHFKCYNLEVIDRFPLDVKKKRVRVADTNFKEIRIVKVTGIPLLCNPVEKFSVTGQQLSEIKNPDVHLTCYTVKPRPIDGGGERVKFDTNNQFGPEVLRTKLHDEETATGKIFRHELCVPTLKDLPM